MALVKALFLVGYLLGAALLIPFAPWGAHAGLLLLLGVASAPLCVTGFTLGRSEGQPSSAALADGWMRALVPALGAVGALVALPVGLWLFAALPDAGPLRVVATGGWFILAGGVAGYSLVRTPWPR